MHTLSSLQKIFIEALEQTKFTGNPESLYAPVHYIMQLGGKRIRPILSLIACDLFGENPKKALPAAMTVEIFHNFSLVHDDIMDDAPLRRGQPTVHEKFSPNTAILSGDVMLVKAYQALEEVEDPHQLAALIKIFNRVGVEVCEGQQMDMEFESKTVVTIPDYLKMIELKTAALLAGSLEMGAVLGGASVTDIQALGQMGRNVGIAFQLQDDYLDTFGNPQTFGKKVGGDIVQNKKTYLFLKALEMAEGPIKKQLESCYFHFEGTENEKIETVKSIFIALGVEEDSRKLMEFYREKTMENLHQIKSERKEVLIKLIGDLMVREL